MECEYSIEYSVCHNEQLRCKEFRTCETTERTEMVRSEEKMTRKSGVGKKRGSSVLVRGQVYCTASVMKTRDEPAE